MPNCQIGTAVCDGYVMKCKSTGSLVATFSGTNNLRHPYNSIVYLVVPSSIISKQLMTYQQDLTSQFIHVGIQGSNIWNATDKFKQLLNH